MRAEGRGLRATLSGRSHRPCALVEFTWQGMGKRDCAPFTVCLCTRKLGPNHSADGAPAPCKRRQSTEEHATPKAEIEPSVRGDLGRSKSTMVCLGKGGGRQGIHAGQRSTVEAGRRPSTQGPLWRSTAARPAASPAGSGRGERASWKPHHDHWEQFPNEEVLLTIFFTHLCE